MSYVFDECNFSQRHATLSADAEDILFVGDPNLGQGEGWRIFSRFFPNARKLIWSRGDSKLPLQRVLQSRTWQLTVSFYSDYLFSRRDFDHLGLALNLHPSLPQLRGIGYDHIPLIENHREHGGTLHFLQRPKTAEPRLADIDAGKIIRVQRRELDSRATYGDIRAANQRIMLDMLAALCADLSGWGDAVTAGCALERESDNNALSWGECYIDSSVRTRMLQGLRQVQPDHRVFQLEPVLV